jgi:hypothetical protein
MMKATCESDSSLGHIEEHKDPNEKLGHQWAAPPCVKSIGVLPLPIERI